jgi:hypothetical protein
VLQHTDASVCSLLANTPSRHRPRAFLQLRPTCQSSPMQLFSFAAALPPLDSAANWHSNPIAHRVRRKRQRLPPSLLIENASDRVPLRCQSSCPRRFRSSLATTHPQSSNWRDDPRAVNANSRGTHRKSGGRLHSMTVQQLKNCYVDSLTG